MIASWKFPLRNAFSPASIRTRGGCVALGLRLHLKINTDVIDAWTALCAVAVLASGGGMGESASGGLLAQALAKNRAPESNKREAVCIGGEFTMLR